MSKKQGKIEMESGKIEGVSDANGLTGSTQEKNILGNRETTPHDPTTPPSLSQSLPATDFVKQKMSEDTSLIITYWLAFAKDPALMRNLYWE